MVARLLLLVAALCQQAASLAATGVLRSTSTPTTYRAASPSMVAVSLANFEGAKVGEQPVELKVAKSGAYLVHRKIVAEQANMRLGTANSKTRSEVRGGGRKPYQQKGTGRARQGSIPTPLRRGGGVLFGPKPKSYKIKINKKEGRLALSTALMGATAKMTLVEDFEDKFTEARTKTMKEFLDRLEVDTTQRESTLMLVKSRHENTYLSARNIPYLKPLDNLNARDIVRAKKVFVSTSAMQTLSERY